MIDDNEPYKLFGINKFNSKNHSNCYHSLVFNSMNAIRE